MRYQEAIEWLYSTQMFGIKLGLDAPRKLLRDFLAFPAHTTKVIHVAGTNGKGSTCAMIDALARSLGERPGLFTSPHLVHYRERVRVNGLEITEEKTATLLTELREMVSDWEHHPTFFELTLALAMRHFRDLDCSVIVLETGMGGRLDATTAVPADVAVLTPIGLDHTKWLGDTLTEIATEKAGIALRGKPLISSAQEPEAQLAIERAANETQAPLTFVEQPLLGYSMKLPGAHQRENAALACEAMSAAGFQLSFDVVQYALSTLRWPGRFETLTDGTVLDAAHNPHAAHVLVKTWQEQYGNRKVPIIFGAVADKETAEVLKIISEIANHFHFVPISSPRSLPLSDFPKLIEGITYTLSETVSEALTSVDAPRLITGSIFLLGEVKGLLEEKDQPFYSTSQ